MIKKIITLSVLLAAFMQLRAQVVEISPAYPKVGDMVTITYHTKAKEAALANAAGPLELIFSSSTFYDLPWEIKMIPKGNDWVSTFKVQPYATFATFYFQSGKALDKSADNRQYSIAVYRGKQRVKDGYYHESFSIKTQMPKAPDLPQLQLALLQKELELYPDNFEARIRFLTISMSTASDEAEKAKFKTEAMQVIADKFSSAPILASNVAKVITAYASAGIAGKGDSIRKVVILQYPKSDLARQYQAAFIAKETDSSKKFAQLEELLRESDHGGTAGSIAIHKILFQHYLDVGNVVFAIKHAAKTLDKKSPYLTRDLKDIASKFIQAKLAPKTAAEYATDALKRADLWPVGAIRNTEDFGYIQTFVEDSTRVRTISEAKATLLSILAVNNLYLAQSNEAIKYAAQSAEAGITAESLRNNATVYNGTNQPDKAFAAYWKLLLSDSSNPALIRAARTSFLKYNTDARPFEARLKELEDLKSAKVKAAIKNQLLNLPGPEFISVTDLGGKALNKEMLKGKIVVMDFWATWCVPCMKELPYLQRVYDAYKNNPKVVFMVVNTGSGNTINDAKEWAKKNTQYTFPLYFNNDNKLGEKVGFSLIPTVIVLDQEGKLQYRTIGFEGSEMEAKITEEIESLII